MVAVLLQSLSCLLLAAMSSLDSLSLLFVFPNVFMFTVVMSSLMVYPVLSSRQCGAVY